MDRPRCRHCGTGPISRPRGLCWVCFYTPEILAMYPVTSPHRPDLTGRRAPKQQACKVCGNPCGYLVNPKRSGICGTCNRPESERAGYHRRIAEFERRQAAGLPLFS